METCINWCEPGWAYVSTDERKRINKLMKLAQENPDECVVMKQPEDNGGFIYAKIPQKWVRIRKPVTRELTDEQREELAVRMRAAQAAKADKQTADEIS